MDVGGKPKANASVRMAPLRSLDDFLLNSARFQIPNHCSYRIKNNLIYYQSNYFIAYILLFLAYWYFHPLELVIGILTVAICILLNSIPVDKNIIWILSKILCVGISLKAGRNIIITFLGLFFPFIIILIHATFRTRNLTNKLVNAAENSNVTMTPVGSFFKYLSLKDLKEKK